jgi:hypothetical protein
MLLHICRKPIAKIEKLRCNGQKNVKSGNDFIPETRPENRQSQNNKKSCSFPQALHDRFPRFL